MLDNIYIYVFIQITMLVIAWFAPSKINNPLYRNTIRFSVIGFILAPAIIPHHNGAVMIMSFWLLTSCLHELGCRELTWQLALVPSLVFMVLFGLITFLILYIKQKKFNKSQVS